MNVKAQALITLKFEGPDFDDHGLEIDGLRELIEFKKILIETARELWWKKHPERSRIDQGFVDSIRIKFFNLQEGSTCVPLFKEIHYEDSELPFPYDDEVDEAAICIQDAIEAADKDRPLKSNFPKNILPLFENFGKTLGEKNRILLRCAKSQNEAASYSAKTRQRLAHWETKTYKDRVDLVGEVRAADLDGFNFSLRVNEFEKVHGKFDPKFEAIITDALKDHKMLRVRVQGTGEFYSRNRELKKITEVENIELMGKEENSFDPDAKPIWEVLAEIGDKVSDEVWDKLPKDLSVNLDHYLYGSPKKNS